MNCANRARHHLPPSLWPEPSRRRSGIWLAIALTTALASSVGYDPRAALAEDSPSAASYIRPSMECPKQVRSLAPLLLRDLPNYGNRVSQRSRLSSRRFAPQSHILTAEQLEFDTLDPRGNGLLPTEAALAANGLDPIFFTTLERQYLESDAVLLQHYHWVFLTQTQNGWHLAFMYSRLGGFPSTEPPSPPRNSSQGVIAQAVRLWLRDCEAGAVDPAEEESTADGELREYQN